MNNKLLALFFVFILLLSAVLAVFVPSAAKAETLYVCTAGDDLNGRSRPNKHAHIEMKIPNGEPVEAISYRDGWVQIIGGESGTVWCSQQYLSAAPQGLKYRNTSGGRVFVRDDIKGAKTGLEIANNKVVTIHRQMAGWGYTGSGWVDLSFFIKED